MNTPEIESLKRQLADAERSRCAALIAADLATVERLLSDDLRYVHSTGRVDDKAGLLRTLKERVRYRSLDAEDVSVNVEGTFGLWTGLVHAEVSVPPDQPAMRLSSFVAEVWRMNGGRWELVLFQATRAASAAGS